MAQEHRCITLSLDESLSAIDSYRRAAVGFLPSGELVAIKNKPDGDISITVKMMYGKSLQEIEIAFKTADLIPVLLQFCMENNVDVPSLARKIVKFDKSALSLILVTDI